MKKGSWYYQRDRYKQISIKFKIGDHNDDLIYWYLTNKVGNVSAFVKDLILKEMFRNAEEE